MRPATYRVNNPARCENCAHCAIVHDWDGRIGLCMHGGRYRGFKPGDRYSVAAPCGNTTKPSEQILLDCVEVARIFGVDIDFGVCDRHKPL